MNKPLAAAIVLVLIAITVGGYFYVKQPAAPVSQGTTTETYTNDRFGISFSYPSDYVLIEAERGDAHRGHYVIVLIKKTDAANIPVNGEGPPAVTVDIFQNNLDHQTLTDWLKGSNESNYKLGDGVVTPTTLDAHQAVAYSWSGLYEGKSVAALNGDYIVMVSTTWLDTNDKNLTTFQKILSTLKLTASATQSTGDLIHVTSPVAGASISSPVTITGEARGSWFFEASFPITIVDWDGKIIGEGHAEAQGDWMTSEFVPFKAVVTFDKSQIQGNYSNKGTLILKKDNPSGLSQNDAAIELPIVFK